MHECGGLLHVLLQLFDLVLDDGLFQASTPATPTATLFLLLRCGLARQQRLLNLAVGAVDALLLLLLLDLSFEADGRCLDPGVLAERRLIARERLFDGRRAVLGCLGRSDRN